LKSLIVLSGDPGKTNDPFGTVGLQATYPEKKIHIRLAKQHKRTSYHIIAKYYSKVKKQINPHLILIEKNFDYPKLKTAFASVSPTYITMSSGLTEKTRLKGFSVDKPYIINKINTLHKNHQILYPHKLTQDMQELVNQRNEMSGITSPTGTTTTYKRLRNRHDDLFMAKLIGINAIILWWDKMDGNVSV